MNVKISEGPPYDLSNNEDVSVTVRDIKKPEKINKRFMDYFIGDELSQKLSETETETEPEINEDKNEDVRENKKTAQDEITTKNEKTALSNVLQKDKESVKSLHDKTVLEKNIFDTKPKQINYREEDGLLKRMDETEIGQNEGLVSGREEVDNVFETRGFVKVDNTLNKEEVVSEEKKFTSDEKVSVNANKEWENEKQKIVFADTNNHDVTIPKKEVMPEEVFTSENKEADKNKEEWEEIRKEYKAYKAQLVTARKIYEDAIEEYSKEKQNSGFLSHFLDTSALSEKQKVIDSAQSEYDKLLEGLRTQRQKRMDFFVKEILPKKEGKSNESESRNRYISLHEAVLEKQIDNEAKILESLKFQGGEKGVISTALRYTKTAFGHYSKLPRSARLGISMSIGLVLSGGANALGMAARKTAGVFIAPTVALEGKRFLDNKVEQYGEKKMQKQHEEFQSKTLAESRDERVNINRKMRYGKTAATAAVAVGTYAVLGKTDDAFASVEGAVEGTTVGDTIDTVNTSEVPTFSNFHANRLNDVKLETTTETSLSATDVQERPESIVENEHKTFAQKVFERQRMRDMVSQMEEGQNNQSGAEISQFSNETNSMTAVSKEDIFSVPEKGIGVEGSEGENIVDVDKEKIDVSVEGKENSDVIEDREEPASAISQSAEKESVLKTGTYESESEEIDMEDTPSSMDIHELLNKIGHTPSNEVTPEEIDTEDTYIPDKYKLEGIIEKGSSIEREFEDFIKSDETLKEKYPDLSDKDIGVVAHRMRLALEDRPEIAKALHVQNGNWDKVLANTKYSFYLDQDFVDHEIEQYKSVMSEGIEDIKDSQKHVAPPENLPTEPKSLAQETLEALRAEKAKVFVDTDVEVGDTDTEAAPERKSDIEAEISAAEELESNSTDTEKVEIRGGVDTEAAPETTAESSGELLNGEEQNIQDISTDKEEETVESETVEKNTPDEHKITTEQKETVPEPVAAEEVLAETEKVIISSETVSDSFEDDLRHAENKLEEQGADYHGLATRGHLEKLYKDGVFDASLLQGQKHFILSNWGPISHATLDDIFDRDKSLTYTIGNNNPIKMGYQVEELSRSIIFQIQNNLESKGIDVEELVKQGVKEKMTLGDFVKQTNSILDNSEKTSLDENVPEEIEEHEMIKPQELKEYVEPKIPEQGKIEGGRVIYIVPLHLVEVSKDVESTVNSSYLVNHPNWTQGTAKDLYESSEDFKKLVNREKISLVSDIRAYEEGTQPLQDIRLDWSVLENMTPKELLMQFEQHQQKLEELIAGKNILVK